MRLTPLDIRKQEFTRAFRGCDVDEVEAFLQMLSSQWEDLLDENRRRDEKIRDLQNKMAHYEKVEEALQEALQTARETSKEFLLNAENKAKLIVENAERRAEDIKRDAERDRYTMSREASELSSRRSEIIARLRAFLTSEMELLGHYDMDAPRLPAEKDFEAVSASALPTLDVEAGGEQYEPDELSAAATELPPHVTPHESNDEIGVSGSVDEIGKTPLQDDELLSRHEAEQAGSDHSLVENDESKGRALPADTETDPAHRGDEPKGARAWTTRTVVPRPLDYKPSEPDGDDSSEGEIEEQGVRSRASSEEIEKIRRILSGLD